jgi:hypothetical protein
MNGYKKMCILTGVEFQTQDRDQNISPTAMTSIVRELKTSPNFRLEVITATLSDAECLRTIARAILAVKASDVGISAPGSVAEFFLRSSRANSKQKTP